MIPPERETPPLDKGGAPETTVVGRRQENDTNTVKSTEVDHSLCVDCGVDTCPCDERRGCRHAGRWEHYMVHDDVWTAAGMETDGGYMCIGCLESRLSRQLTPADFTNYPINEPNPWNTSRLASRKAVTA